MDTASSRAAEDSAGEATSPAAFAARTARAWADQGLGTPVSCEAPSTAPAGMVWMSSRRAQPLEGSPIALVQGGRVHATPAETTGSALLTWDPTQPYPHVVLEWDLTRPGDGPGRWCQARELEASLVAVFGRVDGFIASSGSGWLTGCDVLIPLEDGGEFVIYVPPDHRCELSMSLHTGEATFRGPPVAIVSARGQDLVDVLVPLVTHRDEDRRLTSRQEDLRLAEILDDVAKRQTQAMLVMLRLHQEERGD